MKYIISSLLGFFLLLLIMMTLTGCGLFINPFGGNPSDSSTPTIEPTPGPTGFELSLNQPVYSDSYFRDNPPCYANDGDSLTGWCAVSSPIPVSWSVKLNASYHLTGVKITFIEANMNASYTINTSTNNSTWTNVVTRTNIQNQEQMENFSADGKYVQMTFTGYKTNTWPMIMEFKVYGYGTTPSPTPATTPVVTQGNNLVINPSFELDGGSLLNPTGWMTTGSYSSDFTSTGTNCGIAFPLKTGNYLLKQIGRDKKDHTYDTYTYQVITGLTNNENYTFSAWAYSDAETFQLKASNYGGTEIILNIPTPTMSPWPAYALVQYTISDIPVTNGQCEIGFRSAGGLRSNFGNYTGIDDVDFHMQ